MLNKMNQFAIVYQLKNKNFLLIEHHQIVD